MGLFLNKTLCGLTICFSVVGASVSLHAFAEESKPIEDTVDPDIFFGDTPEGGIEFIEEIPPGAETAEEIYSTPKSRSNTTRFGDVKDRGPIELKQSADGDQEKYRKSDLLDEEPLFSLEEEEAIQPKTIGEQPNQKPTQAGQDPFQFPDAVEKGAPTGPETPGIPTATPSFNPEFDVFGNPAEQKDRRQQQVSPSARSRSKSLVFDDQTHRGENLSESKAVYDDIEVIYSDRSGREIKIKHPAAEKGLIRITSDRTYIYQTPKSKQDRALNFRFGMMELEYLENSSTGITFADSYDSTENPVLFLEYEWQFIQSAIGKFGLKLGSGVFVAEGNGQFKNNFPENTGKTTPLEKFTFVAFPNSIGAVYRMQLFDNQILVPYADGGAMAITFAEFRDDKDVPKLGSGYAGFFSFGGALNLGLLNKLSMLELDREYGINSMFLTGEFRQIVNLGSDYDFESSTVSGGIMMEF